MYVITGFARGVTDGLRVFFLTIALEFRSHSRVSDEW